MGVVSRVYPLAVHKLRALRLVLALVLLLLATKGSALPLGMRVSVLWLVFLAGPGLLLAMDRYSAGPLLFRLGMVLSFSLCWNFGLILLMSALGIGLLTGCWIWCLLLAPLALWRTGCKEDVLGAIPVREILAIGALLLVVIPVVFQPSSLDLESDIPAHVASIQDALDQGRWRPLDQSYPSSGDSSLDPRMGILHGTHAAIAMALGVSALDEWGGGSWVFTLLYLLSFAWFFSELGLGMWWALLASFALAAGFTGGAPLGIWAGVYPAQVALSAWALSAACMLAFHRAGASAARLSWLLGATLLGLSAAVHPFGWWGGILVLGHLLVLLTISRNRGTLLMVGRFAAVSCLVGCLALLPLLAAKHSEGSQFEVAGMLLFSSSTFVVDPLVLVRWSGLLAFVVPALAALIWKSDPGGLGGPMALALSLPLWSVALNPLVQPLVFAKVGYLSERLGLMACAPALLVLATARYRCVRGKRYSLVPQVFVAVGLLALTLPVLGQSPYDSGDLGHVEFRRIHASAAGSLMPIIADPRSSYALRAIGGGPAVLLPASHASPMDDELESRLRDYRAIQGFSDFRTGLLALHQSGGRGLLILDDVESLYRGGSEYGFIPSNRAQARLKEHLRSMRVEAREVGSGWSLYALEDYFRVSIEPPTDGSESGLVPERGTADGTSPELLGIGIVPASTHSGGGIDVMLDYRHLDDGAWVEVRVQFQGPAENVPAVFRPVSKIYRKLFLERSLRSRARFTESWIPYDGIPRRSRSASEVRRIKIPPWIQDGPYSAHAWLESASWRRNRSLAEYLSDEIPARGECVSVGFEVDGRLQ